jgi:tetratricopeptide (TPR) repeat protein
MNCQSAVPLCGRIGGWGPWKGLEYHLEMTRAAFATGRPAEAEMPLRRAIAVALPGSAKRYRARALLGLSLLRQGRTADAVAECDRNRDEAVADSRGSPVTPAAARVAAAAFNKGLAQDLAGQHPAAAESFSAAAAAATVGGASNIDALLGRAQALRSMQRYREAARDYIAVLGVSNSDGPSTAAPWANKSESRPRSPPGPGAAEEGAGPRPLKSPGPGSHGPPMLGRTEDADLLRLLRRPAAARSEAEVVDVASLAGDMAFFRYKWDPGG